jgi:hypothetical protein
MKSRTLFEANAFLHDPVQYRDFVVGTVASSCAIETGESVSAIAKRLRKYLDERGPSLKTAQRRSRR